MLQRVMHTVKDVTNIIEDLYPVVCGCVTRRKQSKPSNNQEQKQQSTQHRSTARSSADLTKLNQTPTLYTLAKDKIVLQITTPQAASSQRTHIARTQGCGRMHPVNRRVTTQYLCTQSVTTRRRCGRNGKHEAPCELSAHESIGIAADQVESTVSGAARGGGWGDTHTHTHSVCSRARSSYSPHALSQLLQHVCEMHTREKKNRSDITPDPGGHRPQRPYTQRRTRTTQDQAQASASSKIRPGQ